MGRLGVRVIHTRYPHWGAHSGIHQFVKYLDAGRVRVSVRTSADDDDNFPLRSEWLRDRLRTRIARDGGGWYKLSDLTAEAGALAALATGVRVVHFLDGEHGVRYLPGLLRRARWLRARTVATFHQPASLLATLIPPAAIEALDHITVVAPSQAAWFEQFVPADRITTVLHGIDTAFFRPPVERRRESFRCITVGHWLRDWPAVRAVARELAGVPDIGFDVVTSQPTGLEDLGNVRIHRSVDDATLLALYQAAHCLLLPLHDATANNAILEAIACGLPVVTSDLSSLHAYLPGAEAVFVKDNDPTDLAAAVLRLKEDEAQTRVMEWHARLRAEALSWGRIADAWQSLYAMLAGSGGARQGDR